MRAILIDPTARKISEIDISKEDGIRSIYKAIGVDCFCCIDLADRETLYLDDEGLYKDNQTFFRWRGYDQPLAGNGLILYTDEMGESCASRISIEDVVKHVSWMGDDTSFKNMTTTEGEVDHPVFGKMFVQAHTPHFSGKMIQKNATMDDVIK